MRIERLDDRTIVYLTDLELETLREGACSVVDLNHRVGVTRDADFSLQGFTEERLLADFGQSGEADPVREDSGDSTGEPAGPIWGCDPDND